MSDVEELRGLARRMRELAADTHGAGATMRDAQSVDFVSNAAGRLGKVAHVARDLAGDAARVLDLARHAPPPGHPGWLDFKRLLP